MSLSREDRNVGPGMPWWRVRMVWLVLSGPAIVIVAGLVTAFIAVNGADPLVPREGETSSATQPAVQGRNHATTGGRAK